MNAIARYIVTGFLGVLVGVFLTLAVTGKRDSDAVVEVANTVVKETAKANVEAVVKNEQLVTKLDQQNKTAEVVKERVLNDLKPEVQKQVVYVPVQVPGVAETQLCPPVRHDDVLPLSLYGVRLLNGLRTARTVDLTAPDAGESETPAGITVAQFVENDTDVVALYNELATAHDELIDEVVAYMRKQAEQK